MDQQQQSGRRGFVNWFLGTSLGALCLSVVYPVIRFASRPNVPEATTNQVEAGTTNDPELMEKKFKIVRFGADPVLEKIGHPCLRFCTIAFKPQITADCYRTLMHKDFLNIRSSYAHGVNPTKPKAR